MTLIALLWAFASVNAFPQQGPPVPNPVHVATALNHLTVLEFHEPVTLAAAGSADFQIERQEDKVFIKPTKSGAATDLFVWTASRRFAYELETTPEVKNMNVSIDNAIPATPAAPATGVSAHVEEFADMMLTQAFLGAIEITPANAHASKNQVSVSVQRVFQTRTTVYIRYAVVNNSKRAYHVGAPDAFELLASQPTVALPALSHKQLDQQLLDDLRDTRNVPLTVAHAETSTEDLNPGEMTQGVVAIRQDLSSPTIVQLVFGGQVKATFVL
jgi:ribosomal protein S8